MIISQLVDYFLPEDLASKRPEKLEDIEELRSFKVNIILSLTLAFISSLIFGTRWFLEGLNYSKSLYLFFILIPILGLLPFGIKYFRFKSSVFLVALISSSVFFVIRCFHTGGILSPVMPWYVVVPLAGVLMSDKKTAITSFFIVVFQILFILFAEDLGLTVNQLEQSNLLRALVLISAVGVVLLLAIFSDDQRKQNETLIKDFENEVADNKKLASLGHLSGTLAHEINNPLMILSGRLQVIDRMIQSGEIDQEKMGRYFKSTFQSAHRIAAIVNTLKTFSREEYLGDLKELDFEAILNEVVLEYQELSSDTQINIELKDVKSPIRGNPLLIGNLFRNLIKNSIDALEAYDEKVITVGLKSESPFTLYVKDSGIRPTDEVLAKIMEPFYTTKKIGQGSGLGLSLCQNIMRLHGGRLSFNRKSAQTEVLLEFFKG